MTPLNMVKNTVYIDCVEANECNFSEFSQLKLTTKQNHQNCPFSKMFY